MQYFFLYASNCYKSITPAKYGIATSTYFIGLDLGLGFGPYVLGFITSSVSYAQLYSIMAIIVLITAIIYYFLHGRKAKEIASN